MKPEITLQEVLFEITEAPIEVQVTRQGFSQRIIVPGKKALIHQENDHVLGIVGRDYRVVTNREAVELAREVCGQAFPGLSLQEWQAKRVAAPRTLSRAHIDLMHATHVLNYHDTGVGQNDPFTPFLRVTNSFNGARALRFDIGFMRKHCSNGVLFEEEVATMRAAHSSAALRELKVSISSRPLTKMWQDFTAFLSSVRGIAMTPEQSGQALATVLRLPAAKPEDPPARRKNLQELSNEIQGRLNGYRQELGTNAYAVFNTLTDLAARPPDSPAFQKERDTLEKQAGRWLKDLAGASQRPGFDLAHWLPAWQPDGTSRQNATWN